MTASVLLEAVPVNDTVRRNYDHVEVSRLRTQADRARFTCATGVSTVPFLLLYSMAEGDLDCLTDRPVRLAPGDCCVVRNHAITVSGSGIDLVVVELPASLLGAHHRTVEHTLGRPQPTADGTPSVFGHLLTAIVEQLDHYAPSNPSRLAHYIVGLLTLMCADTVIDTVSTKRRLLEQSKEYIECHLGEVDLTPDTIASAMHVSSRTLHRLFENEGVTIATWIRNRRLEHCRVDLGDAALVELPVSHIAARWGLWNAPHFSRLFKSCFGVSPRTYRRTQEPSVAIHVVTEPESA